MAGVTVPIVPMAHQYLITKPADLPPYLPTMRPLTAWVAAGFCAHGLAGAGGMGQLVAEWIVEGTPAFDVWHMDSRRFGGHYASREYTLARTVEVYSTYYDIRYPGQERLAGRPLRASLT